LNFFTEAAQFFFSSFRKNKFFHHINIGSVPWFHTSPEAS